MEEHNHSIAEVYRLQEELDNRAPKVHEHPEYSPKGHKHDEYAPAMHGHKEYAKSYHKHNEYAPLNHTHPAIDAKAAVLSGDSINIDELQGGQVFCTNTAERPVHIRDYFVSKQPNRFNCPNIVIPSGKQFAVRIFRTDSANLILFDGMMNEL